MESHAEMANAQEQSLQLVTQKAKSDVDVVVNTIAAAVAATVALQNQVVRSVLYDSMCVV